MAVETGVPEHASVVVIGGGIIGCSVAYHLAAMGCEEVVLLERDQLTSGTTWHAAGLMTTYGSGSETILEIRRHSMELYKRLEKETGHRPGSRLSASSSWLLMKIGFRSIAGIPPPARTRIAGTGLCLPLSGSLAQNRAGGAQVPVPSPPGASGRPLQGRQWLGVAGLVCTGGA